jgi:hypothetical protein
VWAKARWNFLTGELQHYIRGKHGHNDANKTRDGDGRIGNSTASRQVWQGFVLVWYNILTIDELPQYIRRAEKLMSAAVLQSLQ